MKHAYEVLSYDKFNKERSTEKTLEDLVSKSESIIFVAVPTPMKSTGECDISIVESVIAEIDEICKEKKIYEHIDLIMRPTLTLVIKSTIPPGTTEYLNDKYRFVNVAFNPEFLTEKNSVNDFKEQNRIVIGYGPTHHFAQQDMVLKGIEWFYKKAYPNVPILKTSADAAEMVKYTTNCFLATKVSFANELFQLCNKLGINYGEMINVAKYDERLGDSHWMVPGPMPDPQGNLKLGFSGSCFIKDLNALMFVAKQLGIDPKVMNGVWEKNLEVRPERDWEQLVGRAVVDPKKDGKKNT
jgi:UDPglucose 6-dehydrogenase